MGASYHTSVLISSEHSARAVIPGEFYHVVMPNHATFIRCVAVCFISITACQCHVVKITGRSSVF
uniref:Uncharacterized protein n=1 Tax=Kalanchoe fedtschenkoi TaxID=63787 RepID=A0A7N0VMX9_KALFE